jgi:cytochrome o ubiquinol oxidase subunit 2
MARHKKRAGPGRAIGLTVLGLIVLCLVIAVLLRGNDVILFNPKGLIAEEQRSLMLLSTLIMLGFGVPILAALYFFAWRYREGNEKVAYSPNPKYKKSSAFLFWATPTLIMLILAAIMLPATQRLEPQDQIRSDKETMIVQVVAMRWKWLFIYPDQDIATVNFVQIPVDTPVQFELTADETPMSSFWIPHLGGQLYAMTEHVNRLNLMADTVGDYEGSAAEINGRGFAGMRFTTRVSNQADFDKWILETKSSSLYLDESEYGELLKPSENHPATFFSSADTGLYSNILSKYSGSHEHPTKYSETSEHGGGH